MVFIMAPESPCKNCVDRELGCHSKCQKYKEYRIKVDKINAKRFKENMQWRV